MKKFFFPLFTGILEWEFWIFKGKKYYIIPKINKKVLQRHLINGLDSSSRETNVFDYFKIPLYQPYCTLVDLYKNLSYQNLNKSNFKYICNGKILPKKILKLVSKILKMDQITENFLFLLAFNKRLILLEKILEFYNEISSKDKDIIKIDIILPNRLLKEDIEAIQNKLKSEVKKKSEINFIEDKNIISGFIVKLGSTMIDFSMKSKLDKIINSLR